LGKLLIFIRLGVAGHSVRAAFFAASSSAHDLLFALMLFGYLFVQLTDSSDDKFPASWPSMDHEFFKDDDAFSDGRHTNSNSVSQLYGSYFWVPFPRVHSSGLSYLDGNV